MVNETDLIVQAMRQGSPKRRKLRIPEIEPSPIDTSNDAISKMADKPIRRKRAKALRYWEAPEFLQYLIKALSNHSVTLARVSARDKEDMAFLYDELVRRIGDEMSNAVMRDYLDWWTATYARKMYGDEVYARKLSTDHYLDQFVRLKFNRTVDIIPESESASASVSAPPAATHKEVDAQTLYQMGGLPMLLRAKGVVIAAQVLREKGDTNWLMRISQSLHDFPKDAVLDTMERTVSGAPYSPDQMVDFISIARPALEYHRIRDYAGLNYRDHFKS